MMLTGIGVMGYKELVSYNSVRIHYSWLLLVM